VLLKTTMVFPDHAPKRMAVARKAGSTRNLARRVKEAWTKGIGDEPVVAAETILGLAAALHAHDRLARGHGERVRALTDLIAEELDLPTADRDRLRWSALLHDIGKMAVHPEILNKAGPLDAREWEVVQHHPVEGAKLTAPLAGWLGPWARTIVEHPEKFDGTGYPFGLTGNQISLGGRIEAEPVLLGLDQAGIAVHSGSSCSSESLEPSPVLEAMGVDGERSLRLSVGWSTTHEDVEAFARAFAGVVAGLRDLAH
jgi:putative nucleotidyltransferase with HDIG domain